jgi:hypothetical protein
MSSKPEPCREPSWIESFVSKVGGPMVVGILMPLFMTICLGTFGWMLNMDRTQQKLLYAQEAQTQVATAQTVALTDLADKLMAVYPPLEARVSKIENTRFSAERGNALEDRVLVLEQKK